MPIMPTKQGGGIVLMVLAVWLAAGPAFAGEKSKAVATIGMVADLVRQVGGDRVVVVVVRAVQQ